MTVFSNQLSVGSKEAEAKSLRVFRFWLLITVLMTTSHLAWPQQVVKVPE